MRSRFFSRLSSLMGVLVLILTAASPAAGRSMEGSQDLTMPQERLAGLKPQVLSAPSSTGEITLIMAGGDHICAITIAGAVKCWGRNDAGQLGDGSTISHTIPVPVKNLTSGIVGLAAGNLHTCALNNAGGVLCWGANGQGQLGNGGTTNGTVPVGVSGLTSGVKAIAAGNNFTCALMTAGGVKCWGDDTFGQLGVNPPLEKIIKTPVTVPGLTNISVIALGESHACALTDSGGVKCWGKNDSGQLGNATSDGITPVPHPTPVDAIGLAGVTALATGGSHSCAVNSSGGVVCWGDNISGQLGDGTTDPHSTPALVSGLAGGITALTAGGSHTCALTDPVNGPLANRGKVKCWGYNHFGQLGDNSKTDRYIPGDVEDFSGMVAITAGWSSTCSLSGDGVISCWGRNFYGELGDGTNIDRLIPVAAGYPKLFLAMIRR